MKNLLKGFHFRVFKTDKISSSNTIVPRNEPKKVISPWVWALFIISITIFISTIFVCSWTSSGPTFFPAYKVTPDAPRILLLALQVPGVTSELLFPIAAVLLICLCLRFIRPTNSSRLVFKSIVLFLAARYFIWRTVATLNLSHPASTAFSLTLYFIETISFFSCSLYTLQTIWSNSKQRSREADQYSQDVLSGRYLPSVDVLVPTYNEPDYIIRRTVIGCQAMEYPNKTVYILDDTRRPHIKALAQELGCEYITRPDNTHAKAGNLNNALKHIKGEFIAPFDADFVPFKNFLIQTVGFFQDSKISLVQTPQYFYNPDCHSRNLGLEDFLPNDLEHFYGALQSNRDVGNSVICCGSSYVVRRSCIDDVGGYYTRCCVEDFQTSLRMLTKGSRLIFLNEVLSTGESTRTYADFMDQRLRWLQGNFQVYFCGDHIPIWSKLNWIQKSYAISQFIYCFQSVLRAVFLLAPLCSIYLGISPFLATLPEVFYYFMPFWLLHIAVYGWATDYRVSYFWNEVYETIFCFPALKRLCFITRNPFAKVSRVTRKGVKENGKNYNLKHTWPLILLVTLSVSIISITFIGSNLGAWNFLDDQSTVLFSWLIYNVLLMVVAILSAIDQPVRRTVDRFPLKTACKVSVRDRVFWGYTQDVSENGASIVLVTPNFVSDTSVVELIFLENEFSVKAELICWRSKRNEATVSLQFVHVTTYQQRKLIEMLYTQMTWWKQRKKPGGLDSFLAMIATITQARPLLNRYDE